MDYIQSTQNDIVGFEGEKLQIALHNPERKTFTAFQEILEPNNLILY